MVGRSGTRLSQRVILTAIPFLISVLFTHIVVASSSERTSTESISSRKAGNVNIRPEEKQYQAVPLKYYESEEFNPFDSLEILRYPNDRKRPSSASTDLRSQTYLSNTPLSFTITKSTANETPNFGKNYPQASSDCFFGKNCPENAFRHKGSEFDEVKNSFGDHKLQTSAVPFTVKTDIPNPTSTRKTRTTTDTDDANWVKLEPLPPHKSYDPFHLARNGSSSSEEANSTSLFASRTGIELNPETFAERHGWKEGKYAGPSGSKLPAWLEELNLQHGGYGGSTRLQGYESDRPGYDRDREDANRWVKLEAIPVSGVKISKWVPKNTAPSELPSTSWKYPSKPSWWDRMDGGSGNSFAHHNAHAHHQSSRPTSYLPSHSGWPTRYPNSPLHHHHQTDSWNDVIYPNNNPVSATASWASDRRASSSSAMGLGWQRNPHPGKRYPSASWSSDQTSSGSRPIPNYGDNVPNSYLFARPQRLGHGSGSKPPYYPDPDGDDAQWELISTTKNQQGSTKGHAQQSPYGEFPYNYNNNRHSKLFNFTKLDKIGSAAVVPNRPVMTQDELFLWTNKTLSSLKPVLGGKRGVSQSPQLNQKLIDMLTSTAASIVESTTMKYNNIGLSRSSTTVKRSVTATPTRKERQMPEMNPAIASVGAGMLPSTFGAIVPMIFGRKRRASGENHRPSRREPSKLYH